MKKISLILGRMRFYLETMEKFPKFDDFQPLLGVGAVSKNCVDAVIQLCNERAALPLAIVASRRQVETQVLGGGYSNRWDSAGFAEYIRSHRQGQYPWIARDHGGYWQGADEAEFSFLEAEARAKQSFSDDLMAGFECLHIDTSKMLERGYSLGQATRAAFDLLDFISNQCSSLGLAFPVIELGTEEQRPEAFDCGEIELLSAEILARRSVQDRRVPDFVVIQTGMKVLNGRNVGEFKKLQTQAQEKNRAVENLLLARLREVGVSPKAHNADFLSVNEIAACRRDGITALNIAPELGWLETRTLLSLWRANGMESEAKAFVQMANAAEHWKRWVSEEMDDEKRALISGHYLFCEDVVVDWKSKLSLILEAAGTSLDGLLQEAIRMRVLEYVTHLFDLNIAPRTRDGASQSEWIRSAVTHRA